MIAARFRLKAKSHGIGNYWFSDIAIQLQSQFIKFIQVIVYFILFYLLIWLDVLTAYKQILPRLTTALTVVLYFVMG